MIQYVLYRTELGTFEGCLNLSLYIQYSLSVGKFILNVDALLSVISDTHYERRDLIDPNQEEKNWLKFANFKEAVSRDFLQFFSSS